jgi:hypothetical protein
MSYKCVILHPVWIFFSTRARDGWLEWLDRGRQLGHEKYFHYSIDHRQIIHVIIPLAWPTSNDAIACATLLQLRGTRDIRKLVMFELGRVEKQNASSFWRTGVGVGPTAWYSLAQKKFNFRGLIESICDQLFFINYDHAIQIVIQAKWVALMLDPGPYWLCSGWQPPTRDAVGSVTRQWVLLTGKHMIS